MESECMSASCLMEVTLTKEEQTVPKPEEGVALNKKNEKKKIPVCGSQWVEPGVVEPGGWGLVC